MVAALRALRARPRLLVAIGIAAALLVALRQPLFWTRFLIAWNAAALVYLGAVFVLFIACAAAAVSLAAIATEFQGSASVGFRVALAVSTILCSWLFVHVSFALHYAHEFYGEGVDEETGGLQFPKPGYEPDYWDFLYFAANLGAAAQTSDVMITSPAMRRLVLAHTVLSFLFNTTILALAVNVGSSLLNSKPP